MKVTSGQGLSPMLRIHTLSQRIFTQHLLCTSCYRWTLGPKGGDSRKAELQRPVGAEEGAAYCRGEGTGARGLPQEAAGQDPKESQRQAWRVGPWWAEGAPRASLIQG